MYSTGIKHGYTYSYLAILYLFRFVLKVFYSNIVVEGTENIPPEGVPCMLCANHSNSLTDALLLVTTVPQSKRKRLRLTAKKTQFGRGTFTSWLIESVGTLPIMRRKDHSGEEIDNSVVFEKIIDALTTGDIVVMFPEGLSRYYPEMGSLKQGISRIVSDTLSRQIHVSDFGIAIQTCSITYLHRNLFRSDVLVTFHPPIMVSRKGWPGLLKSPGQPAEEGVIRQLTSQIGNDIRKGTLDAPSWKYIRVAHTARRIYAPFGTKLTLGEYVRITQKFVDFFARKRCKDSTFGSDSIHLQTIQGNLYQTPQQAIDDLYEDLKHYQDLLDLYGIKDDRVRNAKLLSRSRLIHRIIVRCCFAGALLLLSVPGLTLWLPIFLVCRYASEKQKKSGPVFDTYDEIAQTKLVYGLLTGVWVYSLTLLITFPLFPLSLVGIPMFMWITLRWYEDFVSSLRAAVALIRLLILGKRQLRAIQDMRASLYSRIVAPSVLEDCELPSDPMNMIVSNSNKRSLHLGFFSLQRRRKKDWNETLRLLDVTEFPSDDEMSRALKSD